MEADISIWRKTGHFYFALTDALAPFVRQGKQGKTRCSRLGEPLVLDVDAGEIVEIDPFGPPAAAVLAFRLQ